MSETPRLSRRELREQGLLDVATDRQVPTDTSELRLRRPSRKELREAELKATGAMSVEEIAAVEPEAPAAVEPEVVAEVVAEGAPEEAPEVVGDVEDAVDFVNEPEPAAEVVGDLEEAVTEVPAEDVAEGAVADEPVAEGAAVEEAAEAAVVDEEPAPTEAAAPIEEEIPAEESVAEEEAPAEEAVAPAEESEETPQRPSVFDRFEEKKAEAADAVAEPEAAEAVNEAEQTVVENLDDEAVDSDEARLKERFRSMMHEHEVDGEEVAESADDVIAPPTPETPAEAEDVADEDVVEVETTAPYRTFLGFLLIIAIGIVGGYLGGSWLYDQFISSPAVEVPATVALIL